MIQERVKEIICANANVLNQDIELNSRLKDIGINSLTFIRIIVEIETEFDFEFEEEDLDYNKFTDVESIFTYIQKKLSV